MTSATLSVMVLESVESWYRSTDEGCLLYGKMEPVGLIVRTPGGAWALDMKSRPMSLDNFDSSIRRLQRAIGSK